MTQLDRQFRSCITFLTNDVYAGTQTAKPEHFSSGCWQRRALAIKVVSKCLQALELAEPLALHALDLSKQRRQEVWLVLVDLSAEVFEFYYIRVVVSQPLENGEVTTSVSSHGCLNRETLSVIRVQEQQRVDIASLRGAVHR